MTLRHLASAALAGALLLAGPTAQAQQLVHDPRALGQMIEDARTSLQQLQALQAQIEEQRALFESLNDISDVNGLAQALGLPEVRNPLPDSRSLRAAAEGAGDVAPLALLQEHQQDGLEGLFLNLTGRAYRD